MSSMKMHADMPGAPHFRPKFEEEEDDDNDSEYWKYVKPFINYEKIKTLIILRILCIYFKKKFIKH